jgi:methylated-DNA-[protein]-cysteine S-methyltransferase
MGWVAAVACGASLVRTTLPQRTAEEAASACEVEACSEEPNAVLVCLADDLRRYFDGQAVDLTSHPISLDGEPPFRRRVLLAARRVPYGQVRTYGWLAGRVAAPGAQRAAGQAMRWNPLPLVIPCHRVIRADGKLGGFGGGSDMKRALLQLEGVCLAGERLRDRNSACSPMRGQQG